MAADGLPRLVRLRVVGGGTALLGRVRNGRTLDLVVAVVVARVLDGLVAHTRLVSRRSARQTATVKIMNAILTTTTTRSRARLPVVAESRAA